MNKNLAKPDVIQKTMGSFGRYHLFLCLILFLCKILIAYHQMAIIFLAPKVKFLCEGNSNVCPCPNPTYDRTIFKNTIIMEWNLICGRKWMVGFTQMIFQLGTLLGSLSFGVASDRFGRKKPFLVAVLLQLVTGLTAAFVPNYWLFSIIRFIVGLSVGGTMVISFVIIMEFVGMQHRQVISAIYQIPFNLGHISLTIFGYFFREYSKFQLAISLVGVVLLVYFCLVPETPRWLLAVERTDEAIAILEQVARINKLPTDNVKSNVEAFQDSLRSQPKKGNLLDLFRSPNMRKNMFGMSFNWLACSYCFYGVSQYVGQLSGDIYVNVATSASVTLMGSVTSIPLMKIMGRRTIVIVFNFICALCLLAIPVMPDLGSVVCASIGVVSSFIVFVVVYLYCGEMFPTVVRNAAIGFASMSARIGSMIAPFVIDLRDVAVWMPPVAFALLPLIAMFLTFILPETKGCELMTTLEEGEHFTKNRKTLNNLQV